MLQNEIFNELETSKSTDISFSMLILRRAIINPFGAVGKYIYHLFFVNFFGLEGKRNPKYFQT